MGGDVPDQKHLKAIVFKVVQGADLNTMTTRKVREAVQEELKGDSSYDFESSELKTLIKELIREAVEHQQSQEAQKENNKKKNKQPESGSEEGSSSSDEEGSSSSEEEASDDDDEGVDDSSDDDGSPGVKRKKGGSGTSSKKEKKKAKKVEEQQPVDPNFKLLQDLARAMGLTPAIYRGFGEMTQAEKTKALRQRLKEKGAKFDVVPTVQDIKKAQDKKNLERDLEGIDLSNVIEDGSRRRRGSSDPPPMKPKKKVVAKESGSSSEEEVEF